MTKTKNPKLKIPLQLFDKIIEVLSWSFLIFFWVYNLYYYSALPDIIPTHFNGAGEVDGYGSKWTILLLPLIATVMAVGLTIVTLYPHTFNYPHTITQANARKNYTLVTRMLRIMKLIIVLIFFIIDYQTLQIALGNAEDAGKWFLLTIFTILFGWIFYFLISMSKNQ